jgi:hypothetical protein
MNMTTEQKLPDADQLANMADLTEDERAALLIDDDDGTPAPEHVDSTDDNDDQDDNENDDQDDSGAAGKEQPGNADGAAAAAGDDGAAAAGRDDGAAAEAAADEQGATPVQTAPVLVAQVPADLDAKLAEIATKKDALITAFDDGDITAKEYQVQLDAIGKEERKIERDVDKAQLAAEMDQQRQQNDWVATVNNFIANTDYSTNQRLHRALDMEVRDVAVSEEGKTMNGLQILQRAHANLVDANLVDAGLVKAASGAAPAAAVIPAKAVAPKVAKANLPPNLAHVPAAAVEDTSDGRYATLDRLANSDPLAYEAQLAKLPESERAAYLAA